MIKASDLPLVHDAGKLTKEMLAWLTEVERVFPGSTKDIVIIRKPNAASTARAAIGNSKARGKSANDFS
jgi:hypothetical protein